MMKLDLRIREIRQGKGLTLAQLAARIGVSTAHLSEVERGVKRVNNHLLERLSEALGVTPPDLVGGPPPLGALEEILAQLDEEGQAKVEAYASALLTLQEAKQQKP
jgi:transcriptional regulator with XRE-family HTH domain